MTQRNVRGAYMCFEHDRAQDWDWLSKWQPNVIRYMGGGNANDANSFDVNRVRRIHDTCPNATILLRCWAVDDNNFAAHNAMVADPRGTAERQVDWWAKVFDRANAVGVPRNLLMAGLNNETGPEKDASLYPYTEFALQFATPRAVRLGVLVFSVGRPSLAGESQYDIPYFSRLDNAILANNGAVILHEYMQPEGMYAVWTDDKGNERKDYTYLIGRHARWNIKSPIIIGEWGIDGILYNRHPDPKYGNSGWRNFKDLWPPQRYADEYVECVRQASDNVIGICPFLSDFSDHKWQSFDLLDAYEEFLARKDLCVKEIGDTPTTPPVTVHIPSVIGEGPTPVYPPFDPVQDENWFDKGKRGYITQANVNMRSGPGLDYDVVGTLQQGEIVVADVEVERTGYNWVRVANNGWVADKFVQWEGPEPTPTGDNWNRAWPIVLKIEGGLSLDPNDTGNWYNGKLVGTKYGISARVWGGQYDIPNLTKEQALSIYKQHYWDAAGCNALPWPMCLIHFDTAIQHGVGVAQKLLHYKPTPEEQYLGQRALRYTDDPKWRLYGEAWGVRIDHLHDIVDGEVQA